MVNTEKKFYLDTTKRSRKDPQAPLGNGQFVLGCKESGEIRHTCVIYFSLSDSITYNLIEYWSWR